jgi:hypothetical protein
MKLPVRTIFLLSCAATIVVSLALSIGIYFDGGSDIYSYHVIKGNFTSVPVPYFSSFGFYAFTSNILAKLFTVFPNVQWFDFIVFLNLSMIVFLLLLLKNMTHKALHFLLLVLFAIPWIDNILLPELTKQGFWIAFISLLIYNKCEAKQKGIRYSMILLFAYAFTIRAEPAFLAFVSFYLYSIVHALNINRTFLLETLRRGLPILFISVIFSVLLSTNFSEEDRLYKAFRPYQFTLWDFKQDLSTLKLNDNKDSIIFQAAQNHFISDLSQINAAFFKKIGLHRKDKTVSSVFEYFENPSFVGTKIISQVKKAKYYLLAVFAFAVSILASILMSGFSTRQEKKAPIFVFGICLLLLAFLCVFMKLERHVVLPLLMGCALYLIISFPEIKIERPLQMVIVSVGSILLTANVFTQYEFRKATNRLSSTLCLDINHRFPDSIIFVDLYTMVTLHGKLFEKESFPYDRAVSFDNAIIAYYPEWKDKMRALNQPDNIGAMANRFTHNTGKTIFIFNKGREHLFEKYFDLVYSKKVLFKEMISPFSKSAKYPYSYYVTTSLK